MGFILIKRLRRMQSSPNCGGKRMSTRIVTWIRRAAILLALAAIGAVVLTIAIGHFASAPAPAIVGDSPPELGAEKVTIVSDSGATLAGWFAGGKRGAGAAVLLHGVRANRSSMVRRALMLKEAGIAALLIDFQAHGESAGARITFGHREGMDAHAAVAWLRQRLPAERIGAVGSSLGAAAALLGPGPLAVDALVIESTYADIESAIANRVRAYLGPILGDLFALPVAKLFQLVLPPFLGINPADLRPVDRIAGVAAPILVASGLHDDLATVAEANALYVRARPPKTLWMVEGAGHFDLEGFAPEEYRRHVLAFLVEHLGATR
jgi:fermentation-respiration switch protein FrsA (DUF1100 family)